jgi:ribonuclease HI
VGVKLSYAVRMEYSDPSNRCTNNTIEYEALLLGLRKVRALGESNFLVKCDAEVIKDHFEKESEAKEPELIKYLTEVLLTVKIRQPRHEFTFGVGMTFVSYPLVLTPVV